ncbi:MAG: ABC transporter ATP-binding protein, partial [Defluviitaleaceae bacterium]|nr:ABC transporter ATP-binding protein [Defluviitaleaceae bacterium]
AKVRICRLSLLQHNLLVLDEPTNHLDVTAKEVLRQAIAEYEGSVVVISHEKSFADGMVDVTVAL